MIGSDPWGPDDARLACRCVGAGFGVYTGLVSDSARRLLFDEAMSQLSVAQQVHVPTSRGCEARGGSPARRFISTAGGPRQDHLYRSARTLGALRAITTVAVAATGERGTYTFYARKGDHLALHRDIESCDLALITCLYDDTRPDGESGVLCLYPERAGEPIDAIARTPAQSRILVRLAPGESLVMFGGIIPHRVAPMAEGEVRVVSVLCYRQLSAS